MTGGGVAPWLWALSSILLCQLLKGILYTAARRHISLRVLVTPNGLPSGYGTAFACLCTMVGRSAGLGSLELSVGLVFSGIVLHDLMRLQGSVDAGQRTAAALAEVVRGNGPQNPWLEQLRPLLADRSHRPLHIALGMLLGLLWGLGWGGPA